MPLRAALAALALLLLIPSAARAFVAVPIGGFESTTNGIVLGPDGNLWVSEFDHGTVARVTPGGTVLGRFPVGAQPTSLAVGPGGRVWVSGTGSGKLYWIDATAAAPAPHDIALPTACPPIGIEAGNGRIYFSAPGGASGASEIGYVADDGIGPVAHVGGLGQVFDLAVAGGKIYAPDADGDAVRRLATGLAVESIVTAPAGSGPDGVAVDGAGTVWTTLFAGVSAGRFPAPQNCGLLTALPPGGYLSPFGIAAGADGRMYVAANTSNELVRIDPATNGVTRFPIPGSKPWQIVNGPDADLYFTDTGEKRIWRFVNNPPRATTGEARATAPTAGSAGAKVDARGNATTVVFDYGTTTAYGATTAPVTVPAGVGEVDVRADLTALAPNTTYHVRVRAANAEGETLGADTTVTTPLPPPTELPASAKYKWRFSSTWTQLTKVVVRRLRAGDTVKLTCKGKGCGVKSKTRQATGAKMKLTRYFGRKHKLRKGVRVRITVTAPNAIGIVSRLDVRKGKDPRISRRCLPPGATKPQRCSG
jgi:streptogramin lyase